MMFGLPVVVQQLAAGLWHGAGTGGARGQESRLGHLSPDRRRHLLDLQAAVVKRRDLVERGDDLGLRRLILKSSTQPGADYIK